MSKNDVRPNEEQNGERSPLSIAEDFKKMAASAIAHLNKEALPGTKKLNCRINSYSSELELKITHLSENHPALVEYLKSEERKINSMLILAKGKGERMDVSYYETILNKVIYPLLDLYEKKPKTNESEILIKQEELTDHLSAANPSKTPPVVSHDIIFPELPENFAQIECEAKKEKIEKIFMVLCSEKNPVNKRPFMEREAVEELLRKNFTVFGCQPTGRYFPINLNGNQKVLLRYFMYEVYQKLEINLVGTKYKYVNFLIHNFEIFKNDNPATLSKNMAESKRPADGTIINIKRHLNS